MKRRLNRHGNLNRRAGSMMTELIVSGGLMVTAIGIFATSAVGSQRLRRLEQQRRIAVDELSNQLELIIAAGSDSTASAIHNLEPTNWAAKSLKQVNLAAHLVDDEFGRRVVLQIDWERPGSPEPLIAVGWLSGSQSDTLVGETP